MAAQINTQYDSRAIRTWAVLRREFRLDDAASLDAPSNFPQGGLTNYHTITTAHADASREMIEDNNYAFDGY